MTPDDTRKMVDDFVEHVITTPYPENRQALIDTAHYMACGGFDVLKEMGMLPHDIFGPACSHEPMTRGDAVRSMLLAGLTPEVFRKELERLADEYESEYALKPTSDQGESSD